MAKKPQHEFWVTNKSHTRDVSIGDLRVKIRAGLTVNLLDPKHYNFTLEQLRESAENGSLKKRSNVIKITDKPKEQPVKPGIYLAQQPMFSKQMRFGQELRSSIKPEYKSYDALDSLFNTKEDEEIFAEKDADFVFDDNVPALAVDKIYKEKKNK